MLAIPSYPIGQAQAGEWFAPAKPEAARSKLGRGVATSLGPEEREFLRRRVAFFGAFAASLGIGFWLLRAVMAVTQNRWEELSSSNFWLHFAGFSSVGLVWIACRSGERSARFIRGAESIGLVGSSIAYIAMGAYQPTAARPDLVVILALTLTLMSRSLWVPSTGRRTLGLAAIIGVPLIASVYLTFAEAHAEGFMIAAASPVSPASAALVFSLFDAGWWVAASALSAAASETLYGLRRERKKLESLGQYTLEAKLGEGGMGIVYRARHAMLRRPTAVKVLKPGVASEHASSRFEREVHHTARLTHPNTVTVFDYGRTPEGLFYYAMELLEGATLEDIVALSGPQPEGRVIRFLASAASSLAEAHAVSLIHRDIKPGNIMVCERGGKPDFVKVLDFGLVKETTDNPSVTLTQANAVTGTPRYMAPEAITNPDQIDARTDIYALGAVGYFLLTGTHVFEAESLVEICSHHVHTMPEPPSLRLGKKIDADLEDLILRCLAKAPDERPGSASELVSALEACVSAETWRDEDGKRWWREHGAKVQEQSRQREELASSEPGKTIAIDVLARS